MALPEHSCLACRLEDRKCFWPLCFPTIDAALETSRSSDDPTPHAGRSVALDAILGGAQGQSAVRTMPDNAQ